MLFINDARMYVLLDNISQQVDFQNMRKLH